MKIQLRFALFVVLCGVLPAFGQTDAIDAKQAVLIVQHDGSEGQVRVNGVPIRTFSSQAAPGEGPLTDSLGTFSMYAKNGPNLVTVEARPEKGQAHASTTFSAIVATGSVSDLDKPLFKETIAGTGKIEKTITLNNVPQWAFLNGKPFTGNKDEVLAAVRALHKAFAGHDSKAVQTAFQPMYDDLLPFLGEESVGSSADFAKQINEWVTSAKLEALPVDLKVESAYGDRLFVVTDASGKAPIQLIAKQSNKQGHPEWTLETGSYWIHRSDGWFVIRQ